MKNIHAWGVFFCLFMILTSSNVYSQYQDTTWAGLTIESAEQKLVDKVVSQVKKCIADSPLHFAKVLKSVEKRTKEKKKEVKLTIVRHHNRMIGAVSDELGKIFIDINDLTILPDPIHNGNYVGPYGLPEFDPLPGVPNWSITVCSWLGHEIAEMLEDVVKGKRDRKLHHGEIAVQLENEIVNGYYGSDRQRGSDCSRRHRSHDDLLVEAGTNQVEIYHMVRDQVDFNGNGSTYGTIPSGRLAYISWENMTYPGRIKGEFICK